jgi:hypothetical protein
MAVSLYDLSVATYLQVLGGMEGVLAKGLTHLQGGADALVEERLHADMAPFKFQVWATVHHTIGAIEGVKAGLFTPPKPIPAEITYADLQKVVAEAREALQQYKPAEIDALQGKDVTFEVASLNLKLPFTAENFLLSFSLPNFYFHTTTTYDILRHKGVPLGKRDFMGRMRMKG